MVTRQDITIAADKFGRGSQDAKPLLDKLGFSADEKSVSVISKIQCDLIFQTAELTSEKIGECLCEKAFGKRLIPTKTAEFKAMASSAFFGRTKADKKPEAAEPNYRASTTSSRAKERAKYTTSTSTALKPWKF
jgi:hypothetical protein